MYLVILIIAMLIFRNISIKYVQKLVIDTIVDKILPKSLSDSYPRPEPSIPSSPGHDMEWILASKGDTITPGYNFDLAGPLTETVLLGNIPLRMELREKLGGQLFLF
ncbi:hypothetical protein ES705_19223 [subsurface metagenome]